MTAATAVTVGADDGTFGVRRFGNRLFTVLQLSDERILRGGLRRRRGLLGAINLGRVLRCGQVSELQIHGTDRHGPILPPARFVLL